MLRRHDGAWMFSMGPIRAIGVGVIRGFSVGPMAVWFIARQFRFAWGHV